MGFAFPAYGEDTDISVLPNVVYIEPFSVPAGSQYTISVKMKNSVAAEGFGFDLYLPEGMGFVVDDDGYPDASLSLARTTANKTNTFGATIQKDGSLRVFGASTNAGVIDGSDGEVALVKIQVAANMALGDYPVILKHVAVSGTDAHSYGDDITQVVSTVTVTEPADNRTILDESSPTAPEASDGAVNVRVLRTINANEWSTICLPFAMTAEQIATAFGSDVTVEIGDADSYETTEDDEENIVGITIKFNDVMAIEANHPYIIRVSKKITSFDVDGVEVAPMTRERNRRKALGTDSYFVGNYESQTEVPEFCLFLSGNKFWYSLGEMKMKAFRGYFDLEDVLTNVEEGYGTHITMNIDSGEPTGIHDNIRETIADSRYYDLQGRRVEQPGQKGMYIRDGRKMVVK